MEYFILRNVLDGLPNLFDAHNRDPRSQQRRNQMSFGRIYNGTMPPRAWIQQEQRATGSSHTNQSSTPQEAREKGNRAYRNNDIEKAIEEYTKAIEMEEEKYKNLPGGITEASSRSDFTLHLSYSNRASAFIQQQKYTAAAQDAKAAISLKCDHYKSHYRLGIALDNLGQYEDAVNAYRQSLQYADHDDVKEEISIALAKCKISLLQSQNDAKGNDVSSDTENQQLSTTDFLKFPINFPSFSTAVENSDLCSKSDNFYIDPESGNITSTALSAILRGLHVDNRKKISYDFPKFQTEEATTNEQFNNSPSQQLSNWCAAARAWEKINKLASSIESARAHLLVEYKAASTLNDVDYSTVNYKLIIEKILRDVNEIDYKDIAKKLIPLCNPEDISQAEENVKRAQEKLRQIMNCSSEENKEQRHNFHKLLKERDQTYLTLWQTVNRISFSIDALHMMMMTEAGIRAEQGRLTPSSLTRAIMPPDTSGFSEIVSSPADDISKIDSAKYFSILLGDKTLRPQAISRDELKNMLEIHQNNKHHIYSRLGAVIRRTDNVALSFLNALEVEKHVVDTELEPLHKSCEEIERKFKEHLLSQLLEKQKKIEINGRDSVPDVVDGNSDEKPEIVSSIGLTKQQLDAVDSMLPQLKRLRSDVISFHYGGKKGEELLAQEAELEHNRLRLERQRIQLEADLEWFHVVEEDDPARGTKLSDAITSTQKKIRSTVDAQRIVQQQIQELIETDHPELPWKAIVGGARGLKWLKGSGIWLNHCFSDYNIQQTLSSTVRSKVYKAIGRKGTEVALKEVPIGSENDRKRFRNEVNVLIANSGHPNVMKIQGVFFDGQFAYIIMPYFSRGSISDELCGRNEQASLETNSKQSDLRQKTDGDENNCAAQNNNEANSTHPAGNPAESTDAIVALQNGSDAIFFPGLTPSRLPWYTLQEIFRQVVSGMCYLHDRNVIHRDIKPSNIILNDNYQPIITDFGIARDIGKNMDGDSTQTMSVEGTFDFMAPEVQHTSEDGKITLTTKSDIWSLGMTFYAVAMMNMFPKGENTPPTKLCVLMPGDSQIDVTKSLLGSNERLADLITTMLQRDPVKRPSANDLLAHPYFTVSLVHDLVSNKGLVKSNKKMEAFRSFIYALRQYQRETLIVSVSRSDMVESVCSIFGDITEQELLSPLFVVFRGEEGVDEGALTTEMFQLFFQQLITKSKALVHAGTFNGTERDTVGTNNEMITGAEYIPSSDPRIPLKRFNVLGRVLLKCLIENRNIPFTFSPAVFKFILNVPVTMQDLESYDMTLANNLKRLLILGEEELQSAMVDFSDFSAKFLAYKNSASTREENISQPPEEGTASSMSNINTVGGAAISTLADSNVNPGNSSSVARTGRTLYFTRNTPVTAANVREYVTLRVEYELIGRNQDQLNALKEGFQMGKQLQTHLELFSVTELMMQLSGQQYISNTQVIAALQFVDFPSESLTPQHFKEIIRGFSQNNIRRFLKLCTPQVVVPATGLPQIKVQFVQDTQRLPVGHGCVSQLDLPDYNNKAVLREKLGIALAHANDGFFLA